MRYCLLFAGILFISVLQGQTNLNNISLPTIIPASPEVAELGKVGSVSAGLHTGSANVTIPLYTVVSGKAKAELMLNYNSNGIRVDDIPSRVGLGWNLVAGGVVSRTIHDDPDGTVAFFPPPANINVKDQALIDYLKDATDANNDLRDTEWDEFSYSFNGMSGKFFLNGSGDGFCFPHTTMKIHVTGYSSAHFEISIITPDGMMYQFGKLGAVEKTSNITVSGGGTGLVSKSAPYETAWFLNSITAPEGDVITFTYSPILIRNTLGPYQTLIKPIERPDGCNFKCADTYSDQKGVNQIDYNTQYLNSITTNTGVTVTFGYENRPGLDLNRDNRLNQIAVSANTGQVSSSSIKDYRFEYIEPSPNTSINQRYFLSKIKTYSTLSVNDANPDNWIEHKFDYYRINNMIPRLSYQQDWFGFYNGAIGNQNYFAPYVAALAGLVVNGSLGADRNPEPTGELTRRGILTKVTYPTGGTEEFFYEPHKIFYNNIDKIASGLRVNEIQFYDPVSTRINHKYFKYATLADQTKSSGIGSFESPNYVRYKTGTLVCPGTPQAHIAVCDGYMISASSLMPYHSYGGSPIAYNTVLESDDPNFNNGLVEHFFRTDPSVTNSEFKCCDPDMNQSLNFPANTGTVVDGTEYLTRFYKKNSQNNSLALIKEVSNTIEVGAGVYNTKSNFIVRRRWKQNYFYSPPHPEEFDGFDLLEYKYVGQWIKLFSTTTKDYDQDGQNPVVTTTTYTYDNLAHLQPTKVETTLSDGSTQTVLSKYVHDFAQATNPVNVYQKLVNTNQISQVIESKTLKGTKELTTIHNEQKVWHEAGTSGILVAGLDYVSTKKTAAGDPEYRIRYHKVDVEGNVLEVSKEGGQRVSYIYDYGNNFPIAEVKNASIVANDEIAYTSFEADGKGYWEFSGTPITDNSGPTGTKCYTLSSGNISRSVNSSKTYLLTYWIKNASGSISINNSVSTKQLTVKNGWTAYELKIAGTATITISGTGTIDELRLHPTASLMTTYTHKPYIGISSSASASSMLTRFEYDGYNRLKIVRDGDLNILKQYDYAYGQSFTSPCTNSLANWVVTGIQRCKQEPIYNNYTGEKEREEKDMNNCSSTYLQTRWVTIAGNNAQCTPVPNCIGEGKRVIGNSCVDGIKVFTYRAQIGGVWYCTYHYEWLNGTIRSGDYYASGIEPCNPPS